MGNIREREGVAMITEFLHVGVTVIDLEKSISFYKEVIGMEEEYRAYHEGEIVSQVVGLKNARNKSCVLRKGNVRVELLDYFNEEKKKTTKKKEQDDPGLVHIAFLVDDADSTYEKINALGYEFTTVPVETRKKGGKIAYFTGPDNVVIELYEKR